MARRPARSLPRKTRLRTRTGSKKPGRHARQRGEASSLPVTSHDRPVWSFNDERVSRSQALIVAGCICLVIGLAFGRARVHQQQRPGKTKVARVYQNEETAAPAR